MFGNIGTIWTELGLDSKKFNKGMKLAERKMALAGRKMQTIGRTLTMGVSLPLMAVGVAATKAGMDFDDSMTKSLAIMNNVSPKIRSQMEQVAKDVVSYTTFSAKEAADAYFYLASAGLDAAQSMEALPRVAKFAQAGNFDLALATDLLTDAQSALGLTVKDDVIKNMENMVRVSDVLVKANALSNATVQEFSESLTNMGAVALTGANKELEEGIAILAVWADKGIKGAMAGQNLDIVLRDLSKVGRENKGVLEKLGVTIFDSSGEMLHMADIVDSLDGALEGMTTEQKAATLAAMGFQDRSVKYIKTLLGTGDAIRGYEADLKSAAGFTEDVASKQMESFTAQTEQLKNELINAGLAIFDVLRPNLESLVELIREKIKWFNDLTEGQKKLAVNIGLVAAAIGPAVWIFGQMATSVLALKNAVIGLNVASKVALATWGPLALAVAGGAWAAWKTADAWKMLETRTVNLEDAMGKLEFVLGANSVRMSEQQKSNRELYDELDKLTEKYPELAGKIVEIMKLYDNGKHTKKENIDLIKEEIEALVENTKKYDTFKRLLESAIDVRQIIFYEEKIKELAEELGITTNEGNEFADVQKEIELALGITTDEIEEQTESVDDLRGAFNDLIDDIFGHITTYNDFQEAGWAVEEAEKALAEAIKEHGIESVEAMKAQNNLDDAMIENVKTAFELSTEIDATTEAQEEARKKAIELGLQYVATGDISIEKFMEMAIKFGLSAIDIMKYAGEMGIELDERTKWRIIKVTMEASGVFITAKKVTDALNRIPKHISTTVATHYRATGSASLKDFIAANIGGKAGGYVSNLGIQNFAKGGLPNAAPGWVTPPHDNGGILATVHKDEVILNSQQQAKLLFDIAKSGKSTGGKTGDIHLHLEYSEELASQTFAKLFSQEIGKLT